MTPPPEQGEVVVLPGQDLPAAETSPPRFILWDPKDGAPRQDDEGRIVSDGILGRISADNAYLSLYGTYPGDRRPNDLRVGEAIPSVRFSLSGSSGSYTVIRVA